MGNKEAIFIFTKDRPTYLSKTLDSIRTVSFTKYVVDNSITSQNQKTVSNLCGDYSNCIYLGKEEFDKFITKHDIKFPKFSFLLRKNDFNNWNLGYARNFALIYSKALSLEKVLFSDDDIQVLDSNLIDELFEAKDNYKFVGANILGLADDSVLGHIATDIGIINERMLSGGFMVFNPNKIDHYFFNIYNEDWIWLFLQLQGEMYLQTGEVFQELTDPLKKYKDKIMFQEFGEIAIDGILNLYKSESFNELLELSFWERMLKEREEYLNLLAANSIRQEKKYYIEIIEFVKSNSQKFKPDTFRNLFDKYFYERDLFQNLFKSLS